MTESTLAGTTLLMSGGSRGIGLAIALRAARDGANVAILAKTGEPHPKLEGTVHTAAAEIEAAGGHALPIVGDVRDDDDIMRAVSETIGAFGGIDIVVNNASAINLSGTLDLDPKRYDLMHGINARGTFMLSRAALPALLETERPRILTLSPPVSLDPKWLGAFPGYTTAKFGMSLATLGHAAEFVDRGIEANTLWPRTTIRTAAVQNLLGGDEVYRRSRTPEIYADAAHAVLTGNPRRRNGEMLLCEDVLADAGVTDLAPYSPGVDPDDLNPDVFV
ncbi:NAD(P)-dependent oxidoreductase [Pseudoclavibacter chungangensis]|uniref:NAD(P)-dependent oxidoreductase n=1 Tax=Pseudoclavibacter chungangensis TaxID=587635 RepID=A0A7J5BS46_9MICO|nr:NAD(P)-dependent oxidoreductase [Pseudoclavibacter chungangensis]KAB1655362.1 NAD(P)-dependent oxidoreductase [Pseudoclavibacter chungangensis]NYJ68312.1 citronellol/citronellal dehydrogenase [Pseudoclavibacter chungangensis]